MPTEVVHADKSTNGAEGSFSLQDALKFTEAEAPPPPSTSEELAETEEAIAELREDEEMTTPNTVTSPSASGVVDLVDDTDDADADDVVAIDVDVDADADADDVVALDVDAGADDVVAIDVDADADDVVAIDVNASSGDDNTNDTPSNLPAPSSAFAACAMKPVVTNHQPRPRPPPTPLPVESSDPGPRPPQPSDIRKTKKRVPVLHGTLTSEANWDENKKEKSRKSIMMGTWRYNDEANEEVNPQHTFELVSKDDENNLSSGAPQNGTYSGYFALCYAHVTPKGKRSSKVTKINEPSVKLEFRKLGNFYRVQGFGSNALGGDFVLNGTAKPAGEYSGEFAIELRKTYLSEHSSGIASMLARNSKANSNNSTATGTASTTAPSSSLLQSQQASLTAEPTTGSSTTAAAPGESRAIASDHRHSPASVKAEPESPQHEGNSEKAEMAIDSPTEAHNKSRNSGAQLSQKHKERQDIPTNYTSSPQLPTPQQPAERSALALTPTHTGVDRVNGKGMWHAWTRSFDTPLLALLDLFDNAVDASWTLLPSKKEREGQWEEQRPKPKIRVSLDRIGRNGVVIRNASTFIPSLKQVLQVYKSSKAGDEDNSIGENGIGVKHACASLSGLSFVFTKTTNPSNGFCTMSIGILMQDLQRDDGIVLPSVAFLLDDAPGTGSLDEVGEKLAIHCGNFPETWGAAIKEYGDDHFGDGIDRCLQHMDVLRTSKDWRDADNVFAVVLANLKHAAFNNDENGDEEEAENVTIEVGGVTPSGMTRRNPNSPVGSSSTTYHTVQRGGDSDIDEDMQRSLSLLKNLRVKLPYLYLHLHDLDISVENKAIESIYWERRLAELSRFELQLSPTELWSRVGKVSKVRGGGNNPNDIFKITKPEETVRFFCGFDPYRCKSQYAKDEETAAGDANSDDDAVMSYVPGGSANGSGINQQGNNAAIKVYLYSRQSGRLIKVQNDPRNEMGLTAGSTDFCQGMTVIIDDHNGTLPLNPTKQDTAYGHSKHGQIHAANLKEWTAALSHFYWNYHFVRLGSSKVSVTHAVSKTRPALEEVYKNYRRQGKEGAASRNSDGQYPTITPLCRGSFITYHGVEFHLSTYHTVIKIRAHKASRVNAVPVIKHRDVVRLDEDAANLALSSRPPRYGGSAKKKRGRPEYDDQEVSRHVSSLEVASTPTKRLRDAQNNQIEPHDNRLPNPHSNQGPDWTNKHPQDTNALALENQRLGQQLQRYHHHNVELQKNFTDRSNRVVMLQNEVRKIGQQQERGLQEIHLLENEKKRLTEYGEQKLGEAMQWKAEAARLRQKLEMVTSQSAAATPASPYSSQNPPSTPTKDNGGESTEVEKLRRELRIYKSRAEFYKKETEAKKKQVETLMQEKARFEDRVHDLEDAQLSLDTHGGDLLQF